MLVSTTVPVEKEVTNHNQHVYAQNNIIIMLEAEISLRYSVASAVVVFKPTRVQFSLTTAEAKVDVSSACLRFYFYKLYKQGLRSWY